MPVEKQTSEEQYGNNIKHAAWVDDQQISWQQDSSVLTLTTNEDTVLTFVNSLKIFYNSKKL